MRPLGGSQLRLKLSGLTASKKARIISIPAGASNLPGFLCIFMVVLGIETSCDETGVALYDTEKGLLAHALHSQVAMHADYGGVVPELASRDHIRRLLPLTRQVLAESARSVRDIG